MPKIQFFCELFERCELIHNHSPEFGAPEVVMFWCIQCHRVDNSTRHWMHQIKTIFGAPNSGPWCLPCTGTNENWEGNKVQPIQTKMYLLDQAYLPIDYIRSRELCPAVDTFCYGIFMFELVCGRSPSHRPPGQGTDIIITYFTYIMIIIKLYNTLYLVEVLRFRDWNRNRIFVIFHELMIPIPAKIDFLTVLELIPVLESIPKWIQLRFQKKTES